MDRKSLGYLASHEWVHIEGQVRQSASHKFAVEQLTDLIMIELPAVGTKVTAGKIVRRDRERQGGQRPLRAGQRRGDRGQ